MRTQCGEITIHPLVNYHYPGGRPGSLSGRVWGLDPGSLPNHRRQLGARLTLVLTEAQLTDPNGEVKG